MTAPRRSAPRTKCELCKRSWPTTKFEAHLEQPRHQVAVELAAMGEKGWTPITGTERLTLTRYEVPLALRMAKLVKVAHEDQDENMRLGKLPLWRDGIAEQWFGPSLHVAALRAMVGLPLSSAHRRGAIQALTSNPDILNATFTLVTLAPAEEVRAKVTRYLRAAARGELQ